MPPPKKLTLDEFSRLITQAGSRIPDSKSIALFDQFHDIKDFVPPQTHAAWLTMTNVAGHIYGTKSRGDRLMAVDRAYKTWIEYAGPEGITHGGNAENLRNALETYTGVIYRMTGKVSGFSHDYRNERNRGDVMTKTLALAGLVTKLSLTSPESDLERRQTDRRAMLSLIANINVEWNPVGTIIGGIAGAASNTDSLISNDLAKNIVRICEGGAAGIGAAVGVAVVDDVPGKIKTFLKEQWNKFKTWMAGVFKLRFGITTAAAEFLEKAGKAFALVVSQAWKSVAHLASGASDMYEGLKNLVTDAWTRRTLTLQQAQLVTSDGAFALIRNGIDVGIRNRQVVAAWTIAKGVTKTTVAAVASPAASKIADLVLGAFEFIFKLIYNLIEAESIKRFIVEARAMWAKVGNMPEAQASPAAAPASAAAVRAPKADFLVPKATSGSMPSFNAAHYTAQDFIHDSRAAYLNFLHSLVKTSPVLAAVVMNSGAFQDVSDVLHAATPRSTDDVERAAQHIKSLQIEAVRLYTDSGYSVVPNTGTVFSQQDNAVFQGMLKGAQLVPAA